MFLKIHAQVDYDSFCERDAASSRINIVNQGRIQPSSWVEHKKLTANKGFWEAKGSAPSAPLPLVTGRLIKNNEREAIYTTYDITLHICKTICKYIKFYKP